MIYRRIEDVQTEMPFCKELAGLMALLDKINPCNQLYFQSDNSFVISYSLKLNLLNFKNLFPLKANVSIIGLPISMCYKGYWGDPASVEKVIHEMKGLKIVLNADPDIKASGRTLSTFIFDNRFSSFEDYIKALRSPYRRRIMRAISKGKDIESRRLGIQDFTANHYELYLSVMKRTQNPLEILPMQYFTGYDAEIYEFIDKRTDRLLGFVQLRELEEDLYFLFGGFKKEDNEPYDLYYNMLLKILQIGIERGYKAINFGQTAEESKLKIGCKEVPKYLYVHHSNPIINKALQYLAPFFSYKQYGVEHHVFKHKDESTGGTVL